VIFIKGEKQLAINPDSAFSGWRTGTNGCDGMGQSEWQGTEWLLGRGNDDREWGNLWKWRSGVGHRRAEGRNGMDQYYEIDRVKVLPIKSPIP